MSATSNQTAESDQKTITKPPEINQKAYIARITSKYLTLGDLILFIYVCMIIFFFLSSYGVLINTNIFDHNNNKFVNFILRCLSFIILFIVLLIISGLSPLIYVIMLLYVGYNKKKLFET